MAYLTQERIYQNGRGVSCQFGKYSGMQNLIQHWRKKRGLSQEALAERLKCSQPQVQRLERSGRKLTLEWMRRVADALEVSPADLLSDKDNPGRLDETEAGLIRMFRKLSGPMREHVLVEASEALQDMERSPETTEEFGDRVTTGLRKLGDNIPQRPARDSSKPRSPKRRRASKTPA